MRPTPPTWLPSAPPAPARPSSTRGPLPAGCRAGSPALRIPGSELADLAPAVLPDREADIVVYCWGSGCNGSTRAALTLASLGYRHVRELISGFEYWAREGLAIETDAGRTRRPVDELTAPVPAAV